MKETKRISLGTKTSTFLFLSGGGGTSQRVNHTNGRL